MNTVYNFKKTAGRVGFAALVVAGVSSITCTSANAANFFEQLFGGAPQQAAPEPAYGLDQVMPEAPQPYAVHRKRVDVDAKPVLQKTTDLMHDRTLQAGDAVMMKTGMHVYSGAATARHTPRQFVPLDSANVGKRARNDLVAMDTTRIDPLAYAPLREGRSASDNSGKIAGAIPVTPGYRITDARGQSVRYVGP